MRFFVAYAKKKDPFRRRLSFALKRVALGITLGITLRISLVKAVTASVLLLLYFSFFRRVSWKTPLISPLVLPLEYPLGAFCCCFPKCCPWNVETGLERPTNVFGGRLLFWLWIGRSSEAARFGPRPSCSPSECAFFFRHRTASAPSEWRKKKQPNFKEIARNGGKKNGRGNSKATAKKEKKRRGIIEKKGAGKAKKKRR